MKNINEVLISLYEKEKVLHEKLNHINSSPYEYQNIDRESHESELSVIKHKIRVLFEALDILNT